MFIHTGCDMPSLHIFSKPVSISTPSRSYSVTPTWKPTARYLQIADVSIRSTPVLWIRGASIFFPASGLHISPRVSADLCLHLVTPRVQVCTAASSAILVLAHIPSHHSRRAVTGIQSFVFLGQMPFNTQ
jgi:hypothetical protein